MPRSAGKARHIEPLTPYESLKPSGDPEDTFSLASTQSFGEDKPVPTQKINAPANGTVKVKGQKASRSELDQAALARDNWLVRNGHSLTFIGLYLFSILVLFRPYELLPGLGFLSATAFYFALATLLIYLPSQLATEGNATIFTTEIKAILALTALALFSIPIAKDPKTAWDTFNDPFIKAVLIFIVLVNVVRTRRRLMALLWLSIGIGIYLGYNAIRLYAEGKFAVEDYRVAVDVGGLFGNPNDMALHFVMMTPIVLCLALGARSKAMKALYFAITILFISGNMVTFSRGGFLGFFASALVLVWKLGRKHRAKVSLVSLVVGGILMIAAPGNYGLRMLSIFIPGLDPVGSSNQRRELLDRSLLVTARNPWGIGIGNFPIVGIHDHQTHNAYTQVSSEIGILGLIAYLVFIISPLRKLSAIERTLFAQDRLDWFYYLSIGLQASIVGYMVSSFFASVAYNWFIYYGIAYAVAFRRIYSTDPARAEVPQPTGDPALVPA
ncbi:MAG: O-antigen ligase family protein [Pyrinomonadaceae bacterium]|nr:O-antigen ligase family protein [Pyrinomonadaceae bacterium]